MAHPNLDDMVYGRVDRADEAAELLSRLEAEIAQRPTEALEMIALTCRKALKSSRRARPIPQASFEAALALIAAMAEGALERR